MSKSLKPYRGKKTSAESQNIVLKNGEVFFEYPEEGIGTGAGKIKMGDGTTSYSNLPYFMGEETEQIIDGTITVGKASTASKAGTATYSTNSGSASKATSATSATYASTSSKAGTATYSTNSGTATYSSNSAKATSSTSATYATTATKAGTATYATNAGTANYTPKSNSANSASTATVDSAGNNINDTYIKDASVSGKVITLTKGNGSTFSITTQDNNTDTKVTQTATTASANYPILCAPSGTTATTTTIAYFDSGVTLNPNTNTIEANISGLAAKATSATSAIYASTSSKAGTSTYSSNSAKATSATSATYSSTATYSSNSAKATSATSATYSATATYAKNAGTASYTTNCGTATYSTKAGSANSASTATVDSAGLNINQNYIKALSVSGKVITYTKGNGTTGSITTQDTNTTYSNYIGATTAVSGTAGLVPAATTATKDNFLRGDGTWSIPSKATSATSATYASTANYAKSAPTYTGATTAASGTKGFVPAATTATRTYFLRGDGTWAVPTNTDTKNTAGSTNTSSKIFLVGATSQAANPQTYSHDTAYVGTDGCVYSNSTRVATEIIATSEPSGQVNGDYWLLEY